MDRTDKVNQILDAWQAFIQLENRSNARVAAKEAKVEGLWLEQNTLFIDEDLFKERQKAYKRDANKEKATPWMLSFPQIYTVRRGQTQYYPLFSLDIEPILAGDYKNEGWNIEKLSITESSHNLIACSRLEDEQIENIITREGLKRFLTSTFQRTPFKSFENWMQQIGAQRSFSIVRQPYLFPSRIGGIFYNLEAELSAIQAVEYPHWRTPHHPAYSYIFGQSAAARCDRTYYLGAFPGHPPTNSQLQVLKRAQVENLTAVKGPPGTGKTTLILQVIAQQIVNRALRIIQGQPDENNLTLVSSKNNSAVQNVIERLSSFNRPDQYSGVPFLHLNGGNRDKTKQAAAQLSKAIKYLENTEYNAALHQKTRSEILHIKAEIDQKASECDLILQQQARKKQLQATLPERIASLKSNITTAEETCRQLQNREAQLADIAYLPADIYQRIKICFDQAIAAIPAEKTFQRRGWFSKLFRKSEQQAIQELLTEEGMRSILQTHPMAEFFVAVPESKSDLYSQSQLVSQRLARWEERCSVRLALQKQMADGKLLRQLLNKTEATLSELELIAASAPTDFYETFHTRYAQQHIALFHLSQQFLLQEALLRKVDIKASIQAYESVISAKGRERDDKAEILESEISEHMGAVSLLFPVMTCTLLSIRNMLPFTTWCVDRAIIDEAGTIPVHQAFPLLTKSEKAIVVGDPLQLEPITNIGYQTASAFKSAFFVSKGLTEKDYRRYSPAQVATATAYHRAANADEYGDSTAEITLKEHFRCQESIISYCQKIADYDLTCMTPAKKSLLSSAKGVQDGPNVVAYHVEGKVENNVNIAEVEAVKTIFSHFVQQGYRVQDIGVISPFRAQTDELKRVLSQQFGVIDKDAIGTIHTFQGSERPVIILSTRVCLRTDNLGWFNQKPNFLNVAVSRAQTLFVLVGNLSILKEGRFTGDLIEHIDSRGVVLEYKTEKEVEGVTGSLAGYSFYNCEHMGVFEEAVRSAEKELYIVIPEISGKATDKFVQDIELALNRGIKVNIVIDGAQQGLEGRKISEAETKLQRLFQEAGAGKATLRSPNGLNSDRRILVCDDKFVIMGSWNWLSEYNFNACLQGKLTAGVQVYRESSIRLSTPDECIKAIREIEESFQQRY